MKHSVVISLPKYKAQRCDWLHCTWTEQTNPFANKFTSCLLCL